MNGEDICLVILAFIFPPATAIMVTGCSFHFWLNLLLTFLFVLPGLLHAFYLIYKKMKAEEEYGPNFRYTSKDRWNPSRPDYVPAPPSYGQPQPQYGAVPQQGYAAPQQHYAPPPQQHYAGHQESYGATK